jgi:hypothetical protein
LGQDLNPAIYDCSGPYYLANPNVYCKNAAESQASYQARVVYPGFNYGGTGVLDYTTEGFSNYHAAQVIYKYNNWKYLNVLASYTWSKSIDNSSNGTYIANSSDQPSLSVHRARSDFNAAQIFNMGWTLRYPNFKKKLLFPGVKEVLDGWSFVGTFNARTGFPFSVISYNDNSLRGEPNEYLNLGPYGYAPLNSHRHRQAKINEWFNTAAFAVPTTGTYGNAPRNFLTGPAFILSNFGVQRTFPLSRGNKRTLAFRGDAFNVFNCPNLGSVASAFSGITSKNSNYGQIVNTLGINGNAVTNGRRLQLSGTIRF